MDEVDRDVLNVVLRADGVPSPRCVRVYGAQRLAITNDSQEDIVARLPDGSTLAVPSGASRAFADTLAEHADGSGRLRLVLTPDASAELLLEGGP